MLSLQGSHPTLNAPVPLPEGSPAAAGQELAEAAWINVIQRMDEVYSELVASQETLEAKHRELAEAHHFTEGVLAAMTDVLVVCDTFGTVRQVNRALLAITGKTEDSLVGRELIELVDSPQAREQIQGLLAAGRGDVQDVEIALARPAGDATPVTWNVSPLYDGEGRYSGFVAVGRPVGELKRAYAQLKSAHEALKSAQAQLVQAEKMASLGRLVAGVAHELNNPISFVMGNAHAMQRYADKLARYLAALHTAGQNAECEALRQELKIDRLLADLPSLIAGLLEGADRSGDIVDALKRFSAVEENTRQAVDLADITQRSLHWVSRAAPFRVQVDSQGLEQAVLVSGSANQLQQVLVNLFQNAFDAVEKCPAPQLHIQLAEQDGQAVLSVGDNGAGIAEQALPLIFDPFFTTKPVGKGTGLGLSISYGIVERHGGQLDAANNPEGGACFTLRLPLHSK
ncbi:ATP-binding protein [uncultured Aquitalea sp.]|uniref:sensor histidine kinase n=1 Tax=uncultured Aquitalea sp. TaxID=540272 RepID=UPI0025F04CB2|nr:ATP-binding protein [uncultured Aquitalea sp.]